eukprot:GILK01005794.1.p1 GENE.GILK01005794.1~~GILK01005794.1.p1  ORF type:complete len:1050 (-),score=117.21 GILK01005794.1:142-2940(-)
MAPTLDQSLCLSCGSGTLGFSSTLKECICASNSIIVEKGQDGAYLSSKTCVTCANASSTYPGPQQPAKVYACTSCGTNKQYDTSTTPWSCVCSTGYTAAGDSCVTTTNFNTIDTSNPVSAAIKVQYRDAQPFGSVSVTSDTLRYYYMKAAVNCKLYKDLTACQVLGNLCVLQLYDPSTYTVCYLFTQIGLLIGTTVNNRNGWYSSLPWLYYTDAASTVLTDKEIQLTATFGSGSSSTVNQFTFVTASYALNGTYLGLNELTSELILCPISSTDAKQFKQFGTNVDISCTLNVTSYAYASETVFYDLYLKDIDGSLVPVPILITNYRDASGTQVSTQYVRRFFLWDNVSGKSASGAYLAKTVASVIRYAKKVKFTFTSQSGAASKIYPPVVTISYAEVSTSSFADSQYQTATATFQTIYTMDPASFKETAQGFFITIHVLLGVLWIFRAYKWARANPPMQTNDNYTLRFAARTLLILLEGWAVAMFWFIFAYTTYWLFFFKGSNTVYVLLPESTSSVYELFFIVTSLVIACQTVRVLDILHQQTSADVFLLDWEKSRGRFEGQQGNQRGDVAPVSVWRSLFITNEYNELQATRDISVELTLFAVLFFMRGVRWEYWATAQPHSSDLSSSHPIDPLLRYAISSWFWLGITATQHVVRKIFRRWFTSSAEEFTDLCSITNTSVFILDDYFHGYYIHGVSPGGRADGSAVELHEMLDLEAESLSRNRGLIHDDHSDLQTFEIFIPVEMRHKYDSVYKRFVAQELSISGNALRRRSALEEKANLNPVQGRPGSVPQPSHSQIPRKLDWRRLETQRKRLDQILKACVETVTIESSRLIHDKGFWERFLGMPPDMQFRTEPLFYRDPHGTFVRTLLSGREYDLMLWDLLIFQMWLLITGNCPVAILLTYFADKLFVYARKVLGQRNLSRKTLVDECFLI